ncbi:MAG: hypothetical protein IT542_12910 [Rubellimicrobium sp.]|nr:hypothetical protein [Rubellimicrobium sp.]
MISRRAIIAGIPLALAGCAAPRVWAPEAEVARARLHHDGPPLVTLYTCLNNDTRAGAHSGLLINAGERVLFDPAGSFVAPGMVERNDVLFGLSDTLEAAYTRFQATGGYHLVKLTRVLPAASAEQALAAALLEGPVARTQCTRAAASVLKQVPEFAHLRSSLFPDNLMRQMAAVPGVEAEFVYLDDDPWRAAAQADYESDVLARLQPAPAAPAIAA